jgi:hypothetical protein
VNHPGPTQYYSAKVPEGKDVKSRDSSGAVWLKISAVMPSVNAQKQMLYMIEGDANGDLYNSRSDPAFLMHHGMIDQVW